MIDVVDRAERRQSLQDIANASGQPNQPQQSLMRVAAALPEPFDNEPLGPPRDEAKVLQKLATLAAAAGQDWFYRFPVRKQDGGQDYIEGPSIKCADTLHRIYGNARYQLREVDNGDSWTFYVRYTDRETGSSIERAFRQRKSQRSMRTKDVDRQLDIAYQIGQSKAVRNAIVHALREYADFALECARSSLVDKIGKNLEGYRNRVLERLAQMQVELPRVERTMGRPARDWLAPDIARIIAMIASVNDGMAGLEETFPSIEAKPPETAAVDPKPESEPETKAEQS
jgi:hypothetical protein